MSGLYSSSNGCLETFAPGFLAGSSFGLVWFSWACTKCVESLSMRMTVSWLFWGAQLSCFCDMHSNSIVSCFLGDGSFAEAERKDRFMSADETLCSWVPVIVLHSEGLLASISEICAWLNLAFDPYVTLASTNDGVTWLRDGLPWPTGISSMTLLW